MQRLVQGLDDDLSPTALLVLRVLAEQPLLSPTELAERARRHKSQVARALRNLEASGLVSRVSNPEDGRSTLVQAAPQVIERIAPIIQAEAALASCLIAGFSPNEVEVLRGSLRRMLRNLE
jgi:DNA-binding MarR family transcriptional regulator